MKADVDRLTKPQPSGGWGSSRVVVAGLLLVLSGDDQARAAATASSPPPAASPPPPVATKPGPIETAVPDKAVTTIIYWRNSAGLLPIVCFDAAQSKWRGADKCMKVPARESVAVTVPDGGKLLLGGVRKLPFCSWHPQATAEQRLYKAAPGTPPSSYVVWPEAALKDIHYLALQQPVASPQELHMLSRAVAAKAQDPGLDGRLEIDQILHLDLDGDGQPEHLYAVRKGHKAPSLQALGFGAVYLARGGTPGKVEAISTEKSFKTRYKLLATSDLDHNGRPEIWIESRYEAGEGSEGGDVIQLEKGALSRVGTWLCEGET